MPNTCIVCGHTKAKAPGEKKDVSLFRFPADQSRREQWLKALGLKASDITKNSRICSRHFLNGDSAQVPSLDIGKRFASPKKLHSKRSSRSASISPSPVPSIKRRALSMSSSPQISPSSSTVDISEADNSDADQESLIASIGEPLLTDYVVHELPDVEDTYTLSFSEKEVLNRALLARVEFLEAENQKLKDSASTTQPKHFRLEDIANDDSLVRFYTGFPSYEIFVAVFDFLGPAVNKLHYWGTDAIRSGKRNMKLDPKNQFFLTLVRLRLNARVKDLAVRFGISIGLVSRYITTWICFLYHHLKEIEWMPSQEQVAANLPHVFKEKYPSTYAIIDGTEIFIETPSDLQMQSSTWSEYKHHNTSKCLIGCTPNGAVCFVSPLYVGSISDVELTRVSGFIQSLPTSHDAEMSIMADKGFTVRDQLSAVGVDLNIPSFVTGGKQLTEAEILHTRKIASVRIHVERAIGRIKNFAILKGTLPITMARLANQIVCVCAWLTSFQPSLVPPPQNDDVDSDVESYFDAIDDSDYDADESEDD